MRDLLLSNSYSTLVQSNLCRDSHFRRLARGLRFRGLSPTWFRRVTEKVRGEACTHRSAQVIDRQEALRRVIMRRVCTTAKVPNVDGPLLILSIWTAVDSPLSQLWLPCAVLHAMSATLQSHSVWTFSCSVRTEYLVPPWKGLYDWLIIQTNFGGIMRIEPCSWRTCTIPNLFAYAP